MSWGVLRNRSEYVLRNRSEYVLSNRSEYVLSNRSEYVLSNRSEYVLRNRSEYLLCNWSEYVICNVGRTDCSAPGGDGLKSPAYSGDGRGRSGSGETQARPKVTRQITTKYAP